MNKLPKKIFLCCLIFLLVLVKNWGNIKCKKETFENMNNKKIIAFSIWGNNECYNWGAVENALLAQTIYPGWICRFYVAEDIIPEVKEILENLKNVEVVEKPNLGITNAFYRFIPMFEEDCEAVLSRDTDSRLNHREKEAVNIWMRQEKDMLILRDHPNHNQLVMAGMFGVKNNIFHPYLSQFKNILESKKNNGKYMDDQIFLRDIYQELKKQNKLSIYDSHHHFKDEKVNPYPQTDFKGYIGQIVCNDFTLTNEKYHKNLKNTSIEKPYAIPDDSEV